jgi:hypothetical protein
MCNVKVEHAKVAKRASYKMPFLLLLHAQLLFMNRLALPDGGFGEGLFERLG